MPLDITLPYKWKPRNYQHPVWNYFQRGGKKALSLWHRRAGKDETALHLEACAAFERPGNYWHMLPEAAQARKAIWEAVNPHSGKRRIDEAFPNAIRETTRENEMFIRFINGSTWQVLGSDNFEGLIGSPPVGMVASEWAMADPKCWAYLRPILAENGGWIWFITTPRGKNHVYKMFEAYKDDPEWLVEKLTVDDTNAISKKTLASELRDMQIEYGDDHGMSLFQQEYYCSFETSVVGSYYGDLMQKAQLEGRITRVPPTPGAPTFTGWDLGYGDSTAIWWAQLVGKEPRIIDYMEASGKGLEYYVSEVHKRDYNYAQHFLPHDAGHGSLRTGKTLEQQIVEMGIEKRRVTVLARTDLEAGISQVRSFLPQAFFDLEKCERGLECLKSYQRKWDEQKRVYANLPLHNFASDGADALRYLVVGLSEYRAPLVKPSGAMYIQNATPQGWMN